VCSSNSEGDPWLDAEYVRCSRSARVDGLILSLASETEPCDASTRLRVETPCVLLDREVEGLRGGAS